jgi:hypothetical protein
VCTQLQDRSGSSTACHGRPYSGDRASWISSRRYSDYSEVDQDNLSILDQVDTILLGSRTYRMFVEYWPTAEDELMADVVNSTPKIVFSSTLDRAPWGRFEPAGC